MPFETIVTWIITASLMGSFLFLLLVGVRRGIRKYLGSKWLHIIWFLVFIKLLVPFGPESQYSIFNLVNFLSRGIVRTANSIMLQDPVADKQYLTFSVGAGMTDHHAGISVREDISNGQDIFSTHLSIEFSELLFFIWLFGCIVTALAFLVTNMRIRYQMKQTTFPCDASISSLVDMAKLQMDITAPIQVYYSTAFRSPVLFGSIFPRLILPYDIKDRLNKKELEYVIYHELSHFKSKDILIFQILSVLQCMHWFNPFVWIAISVFKDDIELSCDARTLSRLSPKGYKGYGKAIISMLESFSRPSRFSSYAGFGSKMAYLKKRITLVSRFKKRNVIWSFLAVVFFFMSCALFLTSPISRKTELDKEDAKGKWEVVDIVRHPDYFAPDTPRWTQPFFVEDIYILPDGAIAQTPYQWHGSNIENPYTGEQISYYIEVINGDTYLFFEWNKNDFTESLYYVFRQIDNKWYLYENLPHMADQLELPFVDDPEVRGTWKTLNEKEYLEKTYVPQDAAENYLQKVKFAENGQLIMLFPEKIIDVNLITWTDGKILYKKDEIGKYFFLKNFTGTYLILEWNSDSYLYRGRNPRYYYLIRSDVEL